ncbi:uncharacterized protein MYCGRDRAFT_103805 [Zymoseptoria tritici IPO323]|uniref:Uncharacterized protein n=1 Tax=Zymoseptoria tritici (strain CBS 115943 / IPO323) TaxID=336722 RepID=F9X6Y7_ZYMTI|nr:uncharacterized protein MYCGRDRAFT_103805 [Zymoseptoria tritici IPO323]EGP88899.1 hypothetical protein MYCGRDRAFT_103805 [Zymoseptoria tritici IPO323]
MWSEHDYNMMEDSRLEFRTDPHCLQYPRHWPEAVSPPIRYAGNLISAVWALWVVEDARKVACTFETMVALCWLYSMDKGGGLGPPRVNGVGLLCCVRVTWGLECVRRRISCSRVRSTADLVANICCAMQRCSASFPHRVTG